MKYPVLNKKDRQRFHAKVPCGGISCCDLKDENMLKKAENVCGYGDSLIARKGLSVIASAEKLFNEKAKMVYIPFTFTGVHVKRNGIQYELAYTVVWDGDSMGQTEVYLCCGNDCVLIGSIPFERTTEDLFYMPDGLLFFQGSPTLGGGIYAFIKLSAYGYKSYYYCYEIDENFEKWEKINDDNFYYPTIYVNGHGTLYEDNSELLFPNEAVELEELNLLTGWFYAYFTSDGYSSVFQLPISNLDDENLVCRIYHTPTSYAEWVVEAGKSTAQTEFFGTGIILNCERSTGTLSFVTEGGLDFAVPKMAKYSDNNMRIFACKTVPDGYEQVIGSTCCKNFNSRLYFYGNKDFPEKIVVSNQSRPLYFPKSGELSVGDKKSAINALAESKNRLVAFKPEGVYRIYNSEGSEYSNKEILIGAGTGFYKADSLKSELLYSNCASGCGYPKTLCSFDGNVIWTDVDKTVYCISNSGKVLTLSNKIADILSSMGENIGRLCACGKQGVYMLWLDNKALVLQFSKDFSSYSWYLWTFPKGVYVNSATSLDGEIILACSSKYTQFQWIAGLGGNVDLLFSSVTNQETHPIKTDLTTTRYMLGKPEYRKAIDAVYLTAAFADDLEISLEGGQPVILSGNLTEQQVLNGETQVVRLRPRLRGVNGVEISLSGTAPLLVGDTVFHYRNLSEVK